MSSCSLWRHCCVVRCSRGPILFSPTPRTSSWGKHRRTLSRHRLSWNLRTVWLHNRCTFSCRPRNLCRSNPAVLCNRVSKYQRRTGVCSALDPPKQQAVSPAPSSSCFPAVSWIWHPQFSSAPASSVSALPPWRGDRWSRGGWRRLRGGGRQSSAWRMQVGPRAEYFKVEVAHDWWKGRPMGIRSVGDWRRTRMQHGERISEVFHRMINWWFIDSCVTLHWILFRIPLLSIQWEACRKLCVVCKFEMGQKQHSRIGAPR